MIGQLPVRASRLLHRPLKFDSIHIPSATLFPFFDGSGNAEHVLIVDADSAELQTFSLRTSRVSVPLWGTMRIEGESPERLSDEVLQQIAPLWHYDPWWLLKDERFKDHPAVPVLKATNCADSFTVTPRNVCFHRSLDRVTWVSCLNNTQSPRYKRFSPSMLPPRSTEQVT